MVSLRRREVIIAGLASFFPPLLSFAAPPEKVILSGRILDRDGKALAGATVEAGGSATTDADGRFLLVTSTRAYRGVTCDGCPVEGFVSNRRRDHDGTWRATVGLTLA
jgi:hypothetical protein